MIAIKHILITAGGTVEPIDGVRQISNTSTGSLSAAIYEALAERLDCTNCAGKGFMVHYVMTSTAIRPEMKYSLPITFYPVTDVNSVETVLRRLLTEQKIDFVIHGMAVSDFTKDYLIARETLIGELSDTIYDAMTTGSETLTREKLGAIIRDVVGQPKRSLDASQKVGSNAELVLTLKKTPKLIEMIKKLSPETFLVGFKLLKGVSEAELIRVAAELAEKNGCDLVLANDMNKIDKDRHEGLLIKDGKVVGRYGTKKEIARGIAGYILGR